MAIYLTENGYTEYTKNTDDKNSHGLGLWEVRQFLNKRDNLNLHTTKNNTYFIQQFEIFNK